MSIDHGAYIIRGYEALGTMWWIEIFDNIDQSNIRELERKLTDHIISFEDRYSRFRKDSEVYHLNRVGSCRPSAQLFRMVYFADRMRSETSGIFDPFLGSILDERGYGEKLMKNKQSISTSNRSDIQISEDNISLPAGVRFDPGGFGKGYLIKELKEILEIAGYRYFLINGGGDLSLSSDNGKAIEIILTDPFEPTISYGAISLRNISFASSSTIHRKWIDKDGIERGHLLDPSQKERMIRNVSYVVAEDPTIADIAATILAVIEMEKGISVVYEFLERYQIKYLVVDENRRHFSKEFPKISQ